MERPYQITMLMLEVPEPQGHPSARWYFSLLNEMARQGHKVDAFVASSKPEKTSATLERFKDFKNINLKIYDFPKRSGFLAKLSTFIKPYSHQFSNQLINDFRNIARKADVVHLEQLWTGWLGQEFAHKAVVNVHHLLHFDLQEVKPTSLKEGLLQPLTFYHEKKMLRRFPQLSAVSPQLVQRIKSVHASGEVFHTPFCVDLQSYSYIADDDRGQGCTIGVVGNMDWYPSFSAADNMLRNYWPMIKAKLPQARLSIVGWNAADYFSHYAGDDIEIHSSVPDVKPFLQKMNVFLYTPTRGSGIKVKVLEAMAQGVPVATNSHGIEGIDFVDGVHGYVSDQPQELVDKVVELTGNMDRQNSLRAEARQLAEKSCDPVASFAVLKSHYQKIIANR